MQVTTFNPHQIRDSSELTELSPLHKRRQMYTMQSSEMVEDYTPP